MLDVELYSLPTSGRNRIGVYWNTFWWRKQMYQHHMVWDGFTDTYLDCQSITPGPLTTSQ